MKFTDLKTTKLGTMAEDMLINEFVLAKGYIPFTPSVSMAHPIDVIAMSGASTWYMDVKCKSRMVYHPFTGIDRADWEKYIAYEHPVYLLFADPSMGQVYGQWCKRLMDQPSKVYGDVIVWPITGMTHYRYMTEAETNSLRELENSNYR
jgi:hypothetical protein